MLEKITAYYLENSEIIKISFSTLLLMIAAVLADRTWEILEKFFKKKSFGIVIRIASKKIWGKIRAFWRKPFLAVTINVGFILILVWYAVSIQSRLQDAHDIRLIKEIIDNLEKGKATAPEVGD